MKNVISANLAHVIFFGVLACAVATIGLLDSGKSKQVDLAELPAVQGAASN
ncbi:hypothetical protein [Pseudophaeobacter sp. EL27]|uniref:hypothetical protein n=1 Tax=Pseudophaeobacter sp. EL27 TaxID=2107580 RepID=UPI0013C4206E|nr:hypothetical protein [Pseudophaeobacter sp. EL27]